MAKKAKMSGSLGIYVDCPSLWHGAFAWAKGNVKAGAKLRVDYSLLLKLMQQHGKPTLTRAYVVASHGVDVLGFKNVLESLGYEVVLIEDSKSCRWRLQQDILHGALTVKLDNIAIACDDPMIYDAAKTAAGVSKVHWYAFGIDQEGPHQPHRLGAEVLL